MNVVPPAISRQARIGAIAVAAALALVGAIPFLAATTFIGDDHLFLAFSRYAPHPLMAFVRDQHGGEFYRPLPMQLWWALGRVAGGATWPFALLAWLLHLAVALETGALLLAMRRDRRIAAIGALLFFVAPSAREAAYWYSASTDLLAAALGVGVLLAVLRRHAVVAACLFVGACWSKESAIVIPALAVLVLRVREPDLRWSTIAKRVAALPVVAILYLFARTTVLGGFGNSGDAAASLGGKLLQIGAGLVHAAPASDVLADPLAWGVGLGAWGALLWGTARLARAEARPPFPWAPLVWITVSVLPLLAAHWIVGARYFYLAAVGIAWLAAEILGRRSIVAAVGVLAALAGLDLAQAVARRADVVQYEARLSAARRAVVSGVGDGHGTFHIASGIKDLDLAVKADPRLSSREAGMVVLTDVPSSFVDVPDARRDELEFLVARPPLPPSGAYQFGNHRIVGLARRGDDPTMDEVIARLPDIRFVRLRLAPGGRVVWRDVTETWRSAPEDDVE